MKKILLTFITAGALLAVSCTTEPVATETFIREDVVGEWTVNQVAYSGEMPNPINPSALMQFSGIGTQLYGKINIYEDEISDDEGSKTGDHGAHCRGFEKNIDKLLKL